ncbi:MAG: GIY-YIG nuclease family protein [Ignavibacteria bacterium]|nr:GIY-YIG nuclease family protein [Ignavibacteria bacterium]MDD5362226.1 GIY-YIG nuclease family protein [Ignavibacteria bacterium]
MPFYTYILKSKIKDKYYIGSCEDLSLRLERHNSGNSRSTKGYLPWEVVYSEEYQTKSEALKREYYIKRQKSKDFIKRLINSGGRPD